MEYNICMTKEVLTRKTLVEFYEEDYWKLKIYMAKLGIRRWRTLMELVVKLLEEILADEQKTQKYRAYVKQLLSLEARRKIIEEEETTGPTNSSMAGANHDNK